MKKSIQCMALALIFASCGEKSPIGDQGKEAKQPVAVKIEKVAVSRGTGCLHYSGTVEPEQTIPLSFRTTGTIDQIKVQEGDMVRKGQLIATLIKDDYQNIFQASHAKFEQARDAYSRLKSVHDNGSLPEIKWVEMETNLKQAESQEEMARLNLEKCKLISPDDGMIGRRNAEPGQSSISVNSLFDLVKINTVLVKISVPENEISKIKKGQEAVITIMAIKGKMYSGKVTQVGVVADLISRTYDVKIAIENIQSEIKPGMVCDVKLISGEDVELPLVPGRAVSKDSQGRTFVFVVSSDRTYVTKQVIETGHYQGSGIEVYTGLLPNQFVVVEGKEKLSDNDKISL